MENNENKNGKKKVKFRKKELYSEKKKNSWAVWITVWTFVLSIALNLISTNIIENSVLFVAVTLLAVIILIGIIFDMIGIAVASAEETPFHAMASRKVFAAKEAMRLVRNADKVSSFCNDVVGDICSIVSGSASAFIVVSIVGNSHDMNAKVISLILGALVAALTIGGKALGKTFAIEKSNYVVYSVGAVLGFVRERFNFIKKTKIEKNNICRK